MISKLDPGIYNVRYQKKVGYYLEYYQPRYLVPGKNYGDLEKNVNIYWNSYNNSKTSMGVMLTGSKGSGKSRAVEVLANKAIDAGMSVISIKELEPTLELIPFIDSLYNCVVMFDEFSKVFDMNMQNKMLTMFSSVGPNKKLFVITENSRKTISAYIRSRPGRVRYAQDFDRLKEDVILEYCQDHNVENSMYESIMELYGSAPLFTFDHLQALVREHIEYPQFTMEELLELLNLDELTIEPVWVPTRVEKIDSDKMYKIRTYHSMRELTRSRLMSNFLIVWVTIEEVIEDNEKDNKETNVTPVRPKVQEVKITKYKFVEILEPEKTYVYEVDGFRVYLEREC